MFTKTASRQSQQFVDGMKGISRVPCDIITKLFSLQWIIISLAIEGRKASRQRAPLPATEVFDVIMSPPLL